VQKKKGKWLLQLPQFTDEGKKMTGAKKRLASLPSVTVTKLLRRGRVGNGRARHCSIVRKKTPERGKRKYWIEDRKKVKVYCGKLVKAWRNIYLTNKQRQDI